MINKIKTDNIIVIMLKQESHLSIAEISILDFLQRPDGGVGKAAYFNRINVPKEMRNKGIGTKLLKELLNECRGQNIALLCEINPYGDLDYNQLKDWYKKHGFVEYDGILWYIP